MDLPTSPKRCLAIVMLRVVGLKQKDTARFTGRANQTVVNVEKWFKKEDYHKVARICDDQSIKKMVATEAIYWGLEEETLVKLDRLTQDDILRHYRTDYMKAGEPDIESLATQLKARLFVPPPETLLIKDFGGLGRHSIQFRRDVFKVVSKIGYDISEFWVTKEDWMPPGEIPPDLEIEVVVSPGALELSFPLEEHPLLQKLLSEAAQGEVPIWKKEGGRYLTMCYDIYREIRTEARNRTFQSAWEDTIRREPSPLTPNFGDLIYQLAILHRHSPNRFPIPDRELYQIRPRSLFVSELYLGLIHLASEPRVPLPRFLDSWAKLHRDMIRNWSASPAIRELLELFNYCLDLVKALKLDDIIRGK